MCLSIIACCVVSGSAIKGSKFLFLPREKPKYITTISKSEVVPVPSSHAALEQKAMYVKALLECEGSELCFEEVRAKAYLKKAECLKRQKELGNYYSLTPEFETWNIIL